MDSKEIFRLSKQMMDGNKFATWVLELSFIGWYLLGLLCRCIGGFFVNPYYEATRTNFILSFGRIVWELPETARMRRMRTGQYIPSRPRKRTGRAVPFIRIPISVFSRKQSD